jgi:hypothetical protein
MLSRARVCGYELATSDAIAAPVGGPLVRAQLFVNQLLTRPASQAEPVDVVYGAAMPPAEVIADLKALGAGMLAVSDEIDLKEVPPPIVARWQAGAARTTARERRTGFAAPPDAASTAIAVSSAVQVLIAPDIDAAAHQIGWLIDRARDRGVAVGPTVMANHWGTTSHGLQRVILRALDTRLRPTDRLRYSTATRQPRFPEHLPKGSSRPKAVSKQIRVRATKVPQQLWPSWALRLMPLSGYDFPTFRAVASTCLLLPGSRSDQYQLSRLLGKSLSSQTITALLRRLSSEGCWDAILQTLSVLASRLDGEPAPIDYQRRRDLFGTPTLLTADEWTAMGLRAGVVAGRRKHLHAQRHLFELLTGSNPQQAPAPLTMRRGHDASQYVTFCTTLTPGLAELLMQAAERQLAARGLAEPVTWEPSLDWVDRADLPGPELDTVEPGTLQRLLVQRQLSPSQAANVLGTSLEHVRLVLARHPIGAFAAARGNRRRRRVRPPQLTPEHVLYRYRDCGWSYRMIAEETGVSRLTVARFGRLAGVQSRSPGSSPSSHAVDPAWLAEQYLERHRSFTNIAAEVGIDAKTLSRIARRHGIPARPRGNRGTILHPGGRAIPCPAWMRAAFQGHDALQRVERFIALARHPTIAEAAQALGVQRSNLSDHVRHLERDLGVQLLIRSRRAHPMRLTAAGRRFVRQARTVLADLRAAGATDVGERAPAVGAGN